MARRHYDTNNRDYTHRNWMTPGEDLVRSPMGVFAEVLGGNVSILSDIPGRRTALCPLVEIVSLSEPRNHSMIVTQDLEKPWGLGPRVILFPAFREMAKPKPSCV